MVHCECVCCAAPSLMNDVSAATTYYFIFTTGICDWVEQKISNSDAQTHRRKYVLNDLDASCDLNSVRMDIFCVFV